MDIVRVNIRQHGNLKSVRAVGPATFSVKHADGHEYAVSVPHELRASGIIVSVQVMASENQAIRIVFSNGDEQIQFFPARDDNSHDDTTLVPDYISASDPETIR